MQKVLSGLPMVSPDRAKILSVVDIGGELVTGLWNTSMRCIRKPTLWRYLVQTYSS